MLEHHAARYHKLEILANCNECEARDGPTCILADIEGSRDEYLILPACYKNRNTPSQKQRKTDINNRCSGFSKGMKTDSKRDGKSKQKSTNQRKTNSGDGCSGFSESMKVDSKQPSKTEKATNLKITELDLQIIELLKAKKHQRQISKDLNTPLTTIHRRTSRMETAGIITPIEGVHGTKMYVVKIKIPEHPGEMHG